jgi:hypothetical protein
MVVVALAAVGSGGSAVLGIGAVGFAASDISVARKRFVSGGFSNSAWGYPPILSVPAGARVFSHPCTAYRLTKRLSVDDVVLISVRAVSFDELRTNEIGMSPSSVQGLSTFLFECFCPSWDSNSDALLSRSRCPKMFHRPQIHIPTFLLQ